MLKRRRFNQTITPEDRLAEEARLLAEEARRLRKEARGTLPGVERDRLMRKASLAETGSHISEWLRSPGLRPPE
jgi:hypothetical protein